jgi:hypothetical protein
MVNLARLGTYSSTPDMGKDRAVRPKPTGRISLHTVMYDARTHTHTHIKQETGVSSVFFPRVTDEERLVREQEQEHEHKHTKYCMSAECMYVFKCCSFFGNGGDGGE